MENCKIKTYVSFFQVSSTGASTNGNTPLVVTTDLSKITQLQVSGAGVDLANKIKVILT